MTPCVSFRVFVSASLFFMATVSQLSAQAITGSVIPNAPKNAFYADPVNGSMNGDGSAARPWSTFQAVVAAKLINGQDNTSGVVHAGDILHLKSGNHGSLTLNKWYGKFMNTDMITVQAAPGETPTLNLLNVQGCANWAFKGLTIQNPSVVPQYYTLVNISSSDNILFTNNIVMSQADVSQWTPTNWAASSAYNGILFNGTNSTIRNNIVKNVTNAISITGNNLILSGNLIDCFANDGVDFCDVSNTLMQNNRITNHYGQWNNGMHHDGMQGWTTNLNPATNVIIDSNFVQASTGQYPFISVVPTGAGDDYLQGISIFDGNWKNVTVTNNVSIAAHYHGMTFYGLVDSVVVNNTVIHQVAPSAGFTTWLCIHAAKNGTPSSNVTVRNNIADYFSLSGGGIIDDYNLSFAGFNGWPDNGTEFIVADPTTVFVKYSPATATFDLNLRNNSPAIGKGTAVLAPPLDILGRTRITSSIDIGAYLYLPQ